MSFQRVQRAGIAGAVFLLLLGAPAARGAGGLQAFLLSTAPDSLADLKTHARAVGVVYPTYFECEGGGGRIEGHDEPAIDAAIAALQIPLLPRFTCQDGPTVHRLLTEPRLRARTLDGLSALARNRAYAGLSLDLENDGAEDRSALSSFVATLARRLHAMQRKLTVVVDGVLDENPRHATSFYDDRALADAADTVFVLGWGIHWAGSGPGPIAPLPWVRRIVARLASLPHARRFVLGAPMYGLDWALGPGLTAGPGGIALTAGPGGIALPAGPGGIPLPALAGGMATARQFADVATLAHAVGARPLRDRSADELTFSYQSRGIAHRVWYLDARAILDRLKLAHVHGLAAGVWRLGREDQALWASASVF